MGIEVVIDASAIEQKLKNCINDDVRLFAHNTLYRQMEPYVPADTLTMYDTAQITAECVHFTQPYSSIQWYGKSSLDKPFNYKKDKHPLACERWGDAAWQAKRDIILRDIEAYIRTRSDNG